MPGESHHRASFRDPRGFIFERDGQVYRQIDRSFADSWERLTTSGVLDRLSERRMLVSHEGADLELAPVPGAIAIIRPARVPFISYPYEWCFSQLKDAARLTLDIMKLAMADGFWLRDASAFNVQFVDSAPVFIDTLSLEPYVDGAPWPAYGQFCRHFLAPLALMAHVDVRLGSLLRDYIDGIPLDLASKLLPGMTKLSPGLALHIHAHGKSVVQSGHSSGKAAHISRNALLGMLDNLAATVEGLCLPKSLTTTWGDYYQDNNYSDAAFAAKRKLVSEFAAAIKPRPGLAWDLGANTGVFTETLSEYAEMSVAWDVDPLAVERAYQHWKSQSRASILPLLQDFSNPSPGLGWNHDERDSLATRGPADVVMVLALIHHLAIGNNVPLGHIASWLASLGRHAIVEFVPKSDSQVIRMLSSREDIFDGYSIEGFRASIADTFESLQEMPIPGTERTLFLLKGRSV